MNPTGGPRRAWRWPAGVVLLAWAAYLNSLGSGFHYDDTHAIVENHHLRSLAAVPTFFVDPGAFSREPAMAMYRPVLVATFALNYAVGGYQPVGYRVVSLLLHGLAALMVYGLTLAWIGRRCWAWWAGALFALHPVHTQAVNYISSRSELLCTVGVLVSLYLTAGPRRWRYAAWAAYAGALMSKEAAVVLVPLLFLEEWRRPASERRWRRHLPFWLLTAAYLAVITGNGFLPRSLAQEVRPAAAQAFTQAKAVVFYLKLLAMPCHLSVEPGFRVSQTPAEPAVLASAALVLSLGYWAVRRGRDLAWPQYGLLWCLAGLGLTFVVPLNVLVNEHRLYLPSIGALVAVLGPLSAHPRSRRLAPVGIATALVFGALTWQRNPAWRDELTLWTDAASQAPFMYRAQANLGQALLEQGRWPQAREALQRAVELWPASAKTWNNLGLAREGAGEAAAAESAFGRALELNPDLPGALSNLGRAHLRQGRAASAEELFARALAVDPRYTQARVNLGLLYQQAGRRDAARQQYLEALRLDPRSPEAYNNLGLLEAEDGHLAPAREALAQALALRPDYVEARINLEVVELQQEGVDPAEAWARLVERHPETGDLWQRLGDWRSRRGDWSGAVDAYEQARIRGARAASAALASALRRAGRVEEAIAAYQAAALETPTDPSVYNNLASALASVGRIREAAEASRQALALDPQNNRARQNLEKLQSPPTPPR